MLCFKRLSSIVFISVALTGCGGEFHKYDSSVPAEQKSLIEDDMSQIQDMELVSRDADDLKTIAINDLSGKSLVNWLRQRNRIVVGESYDWSGENLVTSQTVSTPPSLLSSSQIEYANSAGRVDAGGTVTVMVNLGASIYLTGVEKSTVYTVRAANEQVQVWSPRSAGIIQVGEGLFNQMISSSPLTSYAHVIRRASTYLHEATHTDGNGSHRAFAHAECPSTFYRSEFRGKFACEKYLNGPYSRQVVFLRYAIAQACPTHSCTSAEQDSLLKTLADYDSRKLSGIAYADPTPEGYGAASISEISVTPQISEMMLR